LEKPTPSADEREIAERLTKFQAENDELARKIKALCLIVYGTETPPPQH
jgi:hypothetical protein